MGMAAPRHGRVPDAYCNRRLHSTSITSGHVLCSSLVTIAAFKLVWQRGCRGEIKVKRMRCYRISSLVAPRQWIHINLAVPRSQAAQVMIV